MGLLSYKDFNKIYTASVKDILTFWSSEMQEEISKHNYGWSSNRFNFPIYLSASSIRYYRVYRQIHKTGAKNICDIGGFLGAFPLTLLRLKYEVTVTETFHYYNNCFQGLFHFLQEQGVELYDFDPFSASPLPPNHGKFDFVSLLAIVEHYPHSLRRFMNNIISLLAPNGKVYIEVPNIAFLPKRIDLLLGKSPLAPLNDIFVSEIPFTGHHHEFTIYELREFIQLSGLSIIHEELFNYTPGQVMSLKGIIRNPLKFLIYALIKDTREVCHCLCQRVKT